MKQRIKNAISALHDKKNFFKQQLVNAISTGSQQVAVVGDPDISPLDSISSTSSVNDPLKARKSRKLSKIGKAESMQISSNL